MLYFLALLILSFNALISATPFSASLYQTHQGAGMFSAFNAIAYQLHLYDTGVYSGLKIDLGTTGLYYDAKHGENWWGYYCEPIELGKTDSFDHIIKPGACGYGAMQTENVLTKMQVHRLIKKYIKVRPYILKQVKLFRKHRMRHKYTIGVHYRGTDKKTEAPQVKYEYARKIIQAQVDKINHKNYRIFIATDEQAFLDFIKIQFPGKVIAQNSIRSTDGLPIHIRSNNIYRQGKESLIDVLLLSKCNILIRCSSNLSLWAEFFNPRLPVIILNNRY